MLRVVVLGTGTGVGKSRVCQALARSLAAKGCPVQALKPIETGCCGDDGPPDGSDAAALEEVTFHVQSPRPHPLYRFAKPVSPHLAARESGGAIDMARVIAWAAAARNALRDTSCSGIPIQLVETAGGAWSPISASATNVDLAEALSPAVWLVVAPDSLGVLHDVRATLLALAGRGRHVDHLVLSAARGPDASTGTNADELVRVGLPAVTEVLARGATHLPTLADTLIEQAMTLSRCS